MDYENIELVTEHACLLGECPVWDSGLRRILWVDILTGEVHQFSYSTRAHKIFKCGQMVGAIALKPNGELIAALQNGFAHINIEKNIIKLIADTESDKTGNRFNDGKCDPAGRFWAGTTSLKNELDAGCLYALEPNLSVSLKIEKVSCSNGLAWNLKGDTLYYIDTPTQSVVAYDYEFITGEITNKRTLFRIPETEGMPDGMTIDSEGMLWIALWNGWKVSRYNPQTGEVLHSIFLPVAKVTSCTFGGNDLQDLYITTASTGLTADELKLQPQAGCLFVVKNSGFKGLPTIKFKG